MRPPAGIQLDRCRVAVAVDLPERDGIDAGHRAFGAQGDLGDLGRLRPGGATTEEDGVDLTGQVGIGQARSVRRRDAAVDEAMGQADEIAGEPMPAEMGAFPGARP
jgi:hypothetical protein